MIHIITHGDKVRKKEVTKSVSKVGYRCQFHAFEKHLTDKNLGRFSSHMALFKYAEERNMEYIWIAEDSLQLSLESLPTTMKENIDTFLDGPDWNMMT